MVAGDYMGLPPVKPYLDPSNDKSSLLLGANFASAGAGILNTTGRLFVSALMLMCFATFVVYNDLD